VTDPKGVLAVDALEGVALTHDIPALNGLATSTSNVFEETALVGDLQAGQLDAGSSTASKRRRPTSNPFRSRGLTWPPSTRWRS